jgi:hypothetical protein
MRKLVSGAVFGLACAAAGCFPSREVRSAGLVGCDPDEIEISGAQQHLGLIQSGENWIAECRGRTFICSQVDHVQRKGDGLGALFAADHVSCTEQAESPQAASARDARQSARAVTSVPPPPRAAPTGAAGFDFGLSPDAARERCEAAGNHWDDGTAELSTCSGAAADLGLSSRVAVGFCAARACRILIESHPERDWSKEVVSLKAKLEAKYGPAGAETRGIPSTCRSEAGFMQCLATRRLSLRYSWSWASGESLQMLVGKGDGAAEPGIRLVYSRAGRANVGAL